MYIGIELTELIYVIPHTIIAGVKYMRTITMHIYTSGAVVLGVAVAANVIAFFYHSHTKAVLTGLLGCDTTK